MKTDEDVRSKRRLPGWQDRRRIERSEDESVFVKSLSEKKRGFAGRFSFPHFFCRQKKWGPGQGVGSPLKKW